MFLFLCLYQRRIKCFLLFLFSKGEEQRKLKPTAGKSLECNKYLLSCRAKVLKYCSHFYFGQVNQELETIAEYSAFLVHQKTIRNTTEAICRITVFNLVLS